MSLHAKFMRLIKCFYTALLISFLGMWISAPAQAQKQEQALVNLNARFAANGNEGHSYPAPLSVATGLDASLTVQDVAALPRERFVPFLPKQAQPISTEQPLWLRLQVESGSSCESGSGSTKAQSWLLEMPNAIIDRYEVYQRDASGVWQMQSAGDRVPHQQWPIPVLRPRFALNALESSAESGVQDVYIRVVHQIPATLKPVIVDSEAAAQRNASEVLWSGLLAGLMGALLLICLQMTISYRDWSYLWYSGYLLTTMLAALSYSGVAHQFLWPQATKFASDAVVYFVLAAFAFNMGFINSMFGKWLGKAYRWATAVLIAACVAYMVMTVFIENYAKTTLTFTAITVAASALILLTAISAWRKRVPYSGYWLLVYAPYVLSISLVLAESAGQINLPWLPVSTPMLSAILEAIAMMLCLNAYSREKHAQAVREQVAAQRDPLTGFLNEARFMDVASKAWLRASRTGRDISLAYVLVESKDQDLNTVQLEALMLRSVRMVRTAVRDSDGVGRIGRNMLGISMPDMQPGDDLSARLSRLVALGLMLNPQDSTAQAVKFTLAVGTWRVNAEEFKLVDKKLRALLLKDDTERPRAIRFLPTV
jgi:GGDEF domain-containing protein